MSKETPENKTPAVSSAEAFKQRRQARELGEAIELSSGLTVKVRRPEVSKLISRGLIPANLVQVFLNAQGKDMGSLKPEELQKILEFQQIVAENSLVSPKVVKKPNYENNEISLDDLEEDDLQDIWAYVNGGANTLESFRRERQRVLSRHSSEEIPEPQTK